MMSRIGILSPSLSTGDAVSNDVLGMYDVLKCQADDVRVFTETHNLKHQEVFDASKLTRFLRGSDDLLIYHHARGWSPALPLLRELTCRKIIKYHNITPARFYAGFSSTDEGLCQAGRAELEAVAKYECDLYLSDSAFNMSELVSLGTDPSRCFVVPPFHHTDRLAGLTADSSVLKKYTDGKANVLTVGRVVPNKGHLALLEAFATFHFNCNRDSRLIIVGKGGDGLTPYSKLLHRAVRALGLSGAVAFSGEVSDQALRAYYEVADAFLMTSEHEGFCVPLVEAMSMKLPISAFASTAIPETLGDAGLVWPERDPYLMAESIDMILKESSVRLSLGSRGQRRYQTYFSHQKIAAKFLAAIANLQ